MSIIPRFMLWITRKPGFYPENIVMKQITCNLKNEFGFLASVNTQRSIDQHGKPIPWFTYPAIEYLDSLELDDALIFKWGSGNSIVYFSERCLSIGSIESDIRRLEFQRSNIRNNQLIHFRPELSEDYYLAINHGIHEFCDIIIVDGKQRDKCCRQTIPKLKKSGILILDNSDRYPKLCQSLRDSSFIQIDFHGHGPINSYTWTTSFFLPCIDQILSQSQILNRFKPNFSSRSSMSVYADDDAPLL